MQPVTNRTINISAPGMFPAVFTKTRLSDRLFETIELGRTYTDPIVILSPIVHGRGHVRDQFSTIGLHAYFPQNRRDQIAVRTARALPRYLTVDVQVLVMEHGTWASEDGTAKIFTQKKQLNSMNTSRLDTPGTDQNEWQLNPVDGAWGTLGNRRHRTYVNEPTIVGQTFSTSGPASTFWTSGFWPSNETNKAWVRFGHHTGTDTTVLLNTPIHVLTVDAPPNTQIRVNDDVVFTSSRPTVTAGNPASVAGTHAFASPAGLIEAYNTEGWVPRFWASGAQASGMEFQAEQGPGDDATQTTVPVSLLGVTSLVELRKTARFVSQSSFGASMQSVFAINHQGPESWLASQRTIEAGPHQPNTGPEFDAVNEPWHPYSRTRPYMDLLWQFRQHHLAQIQGGIRRTDKIAGSFNPNNFPYEMQGGWRSGRSSNMSTQWMRNIVRNNDQLRQRLAWCWSQVFVVSTADDPLYALAVARFYDLLTKHAIGNFRDLVVDVTFSPTMAWYLTSIGSNAGTEGSNPDENYARELLQLFTLGLWRLDNDGTRLNNQDTPTYGNDDIVEFAKVLSGMTYSTVDASGQPFNPRVKQTSVFGQNESSVYGNQLRHDWGPKKFLNLTPGAANPTYQVTIAGTLAPSNDNIRVEITDAIDQLLGTSGGEAHPNVAPFIATTLIRFLVKSNPSPQYVDDVATEFNDRRRYDDQLWHVVRKILLHDEAAQPTVENSNATPEQLTGKLHEPIMRMTHLVKAFDQLLTGPDGDLLGVPTPPTIAQLRAETPQAPFQVFDELDQLGNPKVDDNGNKITVNVLPAWTGDQGFLKALDDDFQFWDSFSTGSKKFGQWPMNSPSVFNFFDAQHKHPNLNPGTASPEFGILHSFSAISFPNTIAQMLDGPVALGNTQVDPASRAVTRQGRGQHMFLNFAPASEAVAAGTEDEDRWARILDLLELTICGGDMSAETNATIRNALTLNNSQPPDLLAKLAIYAAAVSVDGAVLR